MATGKFVAYYRVSTARQGESGLGLDAQRAAVAEYLNGGRWTLLNEFTEVESGGKNDRPQLAKAMALCKLTGARLVIAKLDRLSRDLHFLTGLKGAGVKFVCADMPDATELTIHIYASLAEHERQVISARTKAALAAAKARGQVLGGWRDGPKIDSHLGVEAVVRQANERAALVQPTIRELQDQGMSLRQVAAELTAREIETPRGGAWTADAVRRAMQRKVAA
jgi:DNA invertase Pin-like site-specific DNA recombinase